MKIKNLDQLNQFSKIIANKMDYEDSILLFGEIGVGKTTFARYFINYLQIKNNLMRSNVLSPTFNIVYDYDFKNFKIMHYDLYRIKYKNEIDQLGIFETSNKIVKIIEWPEIIKKDFEDKLEIYFSYDDKIDVRNVKINGFGKWKDFKIDEI